MCVYTHTHTHTHTERETHTHTHTERERERERERDRETERDRERERDSVRQAHIHIYTHTYILPIVLNSPQLPWLPQPFKASLLGFMSQFLGGKQNSKIRTVLAGQLPSQLLLLRLGWDDILQDALHTI